MWGSAVRGLLPHGTGLDAQAWRRRHGGMLAVLWLHVAAVPIFALAQGFSLGHSLVETSPIAAAAVAAHWSRLSRALRSGAVALGMLTASAVLVHLSGGYIEFHFHFFVAIALLALYQHWLPFGLAIAYVVVHHGVVGAIDSRSVFNHPDAIAQPWKWAGIHGIFVLSASAASVFTWRMAEDEQLRRRNLELVTEAALARLPLVELLDEILARVSRIIKADAATLSLIEGDQLVVRSTHGDKPRTEQLSLASLGADTPERRVLATGDPVLRSGRGAAAYAAVPLLVEGDMIGVLDVESAQTDRFGDDEVKMLQLVADRVAPSIDRARLYEREHRIAETLQRSLLPRDQPVIPGVEVAARYRPAGPGMQIGGDWYDVVPLADGKVGVAIGDVAGHGIDAAALMGQLRTGLRLYASENARPGVIVEKLSALLEDFERGQFATLFYVELAPCSGELRYVCAGHMPALIRAPDAQAMYLSDGRTTPLGVERQAPITEGRAVLAPGGALLLFTDGLVERRHQPIDEGLAGLRELVGGLELSDAEQLSDAVLDRLSHRRDHHDDVALLVVRRQVALREALALTFPARPAAAGQVREALKRWLDDAGTSDADTFDLVVATSQAAADAILGAGGRPATFSVEAHRTPNAIEITVRDSAKPRRPRAADERRAALRIIEGLVDDVATDISTHGTTVRLRKRVGSPRTETAEVGTVGAS